MFKKNDRYYYYFDLCDIPSVTRLIEDPLHSDSGSNSMATTFTKFQKQLISE